MKSKTYRLNQAIALTGFSSRREADLFIAQGRVKVNGQVITDFNFAVDHNADRLSIDDKILTPKKLEYIAIYKPRGIVTTCKDELKRKNVVDLLPLKLRYLRPVGRLDMDSEGLLLLTNDGQLAKKLTHPSHQTYKTYEVTVTCSLTAKEMGKLASGMQLVDGITLPAKVHLIQQNNACSIVQISIREGRNRQLRRMFAMLGCQIVRLVRVAIGKLQLSPLEVGKWRYLTTEEINELKCG